MVSVKQAFASAAEFAASVLEPDRLKDLRLEEVETAKANGADVWLITLSMPRPGPLNAFAFNLKGTRDYKTFAVNKDTGEVLSMKIRELAGD